jgi:energy-coupling factor transport system ATP-binding protein
MGMTAEGALSAEHQNPADSQDPAPQGAALEARGITFRFTEEGPPALSGVSLTLPEGAACLLMGPSGCGKSTLALVLAGLYPEYAGFLEGSVWARGEDIHKLSPEKRAKKVSLMFQNPADQFFMETCAEEVIFALENMRFKGDFAARASELLARAGLEGCAERRVRELSGGELQMLSLAASLACESSLLILDEPLASVDPEAKVRLVGVLSELKRAGCSLLVIDHRADPWMGLIDSVRVMNRGGTLSGDVLGPEEALQNPDFFRSRGLFAPGDKCLPEKPQAPPGPRVVLEAKGLSVFAGGEALVKNVSLTLHEGSLTAVTGRSGAGKTTLTLGLCGLMKTKGTLKRAARAGLVFQNPGLQFLSDSVLDEVLISLAPRKKATAARGDPALAGRAEELLGDFGLLGFADKSPWQLSQGQQRRLAVLTMLAGDQELLFLDEPTYAQDEEATSHIMRLLIGRVERGLAALFVTHDQALAESCADRVLVLDEGGLRPAGGK